VHDCAAFSYDRRTQVCYLKQASLTSSAKWADSTFSVTEFTVMETVTREVLEYEAFSTTGIPVSVAEGGYKLNNSIINLPAPVRPKTDQKTCRLFHKEAQGKEFLTAPYASTTFDPKKEDERGALCREVCKNDPRCRAAYAGIVRQTGVGICKR
jgi:hypothetical protein